VACTKKKSEGDGEELTAKKNKKKDSNSRIKERGGKQRKRKRSSTTGKPETEGVAGTSYKTRGDRHVSGENACQEEGRAPALPWGRCGGEKTKYPFDNFK